MPKQARADLVSAVQWWRRNVGSAPAQLLEEMREAREQLAATPYAGVSVTDDILGSARRLALLSARYFLFYEVYEARGEVMVLRVWHMSRGRPPRLPKE